MSQEKKVYGMKILNIDIPDEILREILEHTPDPLEMIENFKLVSKDFYNFVYREFFGVIDCLSFKENLNFKRMLLVFLNQEYQDRLSKIEKFEFIIQPFADDFKQAMLKTLQSHPKANRFSENPILIQKLNEQIERPIVKDILSVCHQYGLGVKQDENEARKLERKMISDLSGSHQLVFPRDVQIWMDPIFLEWFHGLELLTRLQFAQDNLKHSLSICAKMELVKKWLQSEVVQKEIVDFIKKKDWLHLYSKLQICEYYLSLLNQLNLPWNQSVVTFIQGWLLSESIQSDSLLFLSFKNRVHLGLKSFSFFEITKTAVIYFKLLKLFKVSVNFYFFSTVINTVKEFFLREFYQYFVPQSEYFFLGQCRVAQFCSDLDKKFINSVDLKKFSQSWLKKMDNKLRKRLTSELCQDPDFFKEWKDYCSLAIYCIQKKQGLEEVGMNCIQAFFSSDVKIAVSLQIEIAAYLVKEAPNVQIIRCIKDWINSKKVKEHLKNVFNQCNWYDEQVSISIEEDHQFIQFISKMNWLSKLRYFERINRLFLYFFH